MCAGEGNGDVERPPGVAVPVPTGVAADCGKHRRTSRPVAVNISQEEVFKQMPDGSVTNFLAKRKILGIGTHAIQGLG